MKNLFTKFFILKTKGFRWILKGILLDSNTIQPMFSLILKRRETFEYLSSQIMYRIIDERNYQTKDINWSNENVPGS